MITILSIDGGGIRGIIPAAFLEEIEKRTRRPICEMFDYIAGVSTGAILTGMLTVPSEKRMPKYTAAQAKDLYILLGASVFKRSLFRKFITLSGLLNSKYSVKPLEKYLEMYLGKSRIGSALTKIIIPAYEMETSNPWFFKSAFSAKNDPYFKEVLRSTSAAPTYFKAFKMGKNKHFIDGGIFANNPALCAYADARRAYPKEKEFMIISLGTGLHQRHYPCKKIKNWGLLHWAFPIFGLLQNSAGATVNYQMETLVGAENYHRFQVNLNSYNDSLDNASETNIECLQKLADDEIKRQDKKINALCEILKNHIRS